MLGGQDRTPLDPRAGRKLLWIGERQTGPLWSLSVVMGFI